MATLIDYKITAYVYLVKADRMVLETDVPEEYREAVAEKLIAE